MEALTLGFIVLAVPIVIVVAAFVFFKDRERLAKDVKRNWRAKL